MWTSASRCSRGADGARSADDVRLTLTDVVAYEATLRTDLADAERIRTFLKKHTARITVDATGFHQLLEQVIPGFSFEDAMDRIRHTRPGVPAQETDIPAASGTVWQPRLRKR